jgi:hypothetical protein
MRKTAIASALLLIGLLPPASARAEEPDGALALLTGAGTAVAGFALGSLLLGTSGDKSQQNNVGWLTIQGGFVLAPVTAHAVVGEWGRGGLFAAAPAAAWGGSLGLMQYAPGVVGHGTLEQQRVLYGFFSVAFFSSAVGVVDAMFAGRRVRSDRKGGLRIGPMAATGVAGLSVEGLL